MMECNFPLKLTVHFKEYWCLEENTVFSINCFKLDLHMH